MGKPAEPFSLVLATVVSLLWVQPCESPQCGSHTSLPTRDQRGIMGTISHGHGAVNHWVHKQDHKCHAKFQLLWNLWVCVNDSCVSDSLMMPSLHYLTKRLLCKTNKSKLLSQLCCTAGSMSPKQHQARHFTWRQFPAAWIHSGKIRYEQRKYVREMTSRHIYISAVSDFSTLNTNASWSLLVPVIQASPMGRLGQRQGERLHYNKHLNKWLIFPESGPQTSREITWPEVSSFLHQH